MASPRDPSSFRHCVTNPLVRVSFTLVSHRVEENEISPASRAKDSGVCAFPWNQFYEIYRKFAPLDSSLNVLQAMWLDLVARSWISIDSNRWIAILAQFLWIVTPRFATIRWMRCANCQCPEYSGKISNRIKDVSMFVLCSFTVQRQDWNQTTYVARIQVI